MRRISLGAAVAAFLGTAALTAASALPAAAAAPRTSLPGTSASSQARQHPAGAVAPSSRVDFQLVLRLRDPAGAQGLVQAISTPTSRSFHHYLTASQWEARFSPTAAQVATARAWLRSSGFTVGATSKDRLTISASGTASQVESAFGTGLADYQIAGRTLRQATGDLSVPRSMAGIIAGAVGVNQAIATPADAPNPDIPGSSTATGTTSSSTGPFPPAPPAFLTHPPCSNYYGQNKTTLQPPFGMGYPKTVPDVVCGYRPGQLRSAYGVTGAATGKGVTVAVVDAYGSSTIASDATQYFNRTDPSHPFSNAHFRQINATPFDQESLCGASSWLTEQAIDVESVHSMAPNANILYVGAKDCVNGLFTAEQNVIDNGLANVVTNSWADVGGDLLDDASYRQAFDSLFLLADATGMTIQFSSGDDGDNFYLLGVSAADYPSSSPYITSVGGTTLKVGPDSTGRIGELGWDTGRSFLCTQNLVGILCSAGQLNSWLPASPDGISGGFTSYVYPQPFYQAGIVPADLALRNEALTGPIPMRVEPDISAVADPGTGFLIGLHQTLPNGVSEYTQTRYGGTSLASPTLAGIVADADQVAGSSLGFINPAIYRMDRNQPSSIYDILPPKGNQGNFREDYAGVLGLGLPTSGVAISFRELYYQGLETYCDATGNCASRPEPLTAAPGFDSLTGLGSPGTNFIGVLATH